MEKLDQSTKKQFSLLLAKTSSAPKANKPIVSTVPLAQIRKAMLKDHNEILNSDFDNNFEILSSPVNRTKSSSPISSVERLSPSKSIENLSTRKPINTIISPSKPTVSPSKLVETGSLSPLPRPESIFIPESTIIENAECTEIPMDKIQIKPNTPDLCSPSRNVRDLIQSFDQGGSPMKVDSQSCDIFMDAQSGDILAVDEEEEEIILNIPNATILTMEFPRKLEFDNESSVATNLRHSISSPSIPLRIKTLGLAAGTPLRAIYRNASELGLNMAQTLTSKTELFTFPSSSNSLLSDLIEEFSNTKDVECFKKILSLTTARTGDFDDLTSVLVSKLFQNLLSVPIDLKMKLLTNFLRNESFLLSISGREILEILEESQSKDTINSICQSNLSQILLDNCIEMCCERLSEFKLILLAEFVKNNTGSPDNFKKQLQKSITPLLLVRILGLDIVLKYIKFFGFIPFRL